MGIKINYGGAEEINGAQEGGASWKSYTPHKWPKRQPINTNTEPDKTRYSLMMYLIEQK